MVKTSRLETTGFSLHLMAMGFMLADHIRYTLLPGELWLSCLGRLAFPIFAFLLAEGFRRTRSRAGYAARLAVWAALAELPFNWMIGGRWLDPSRQNVLWTFLLALGALALWERSALPCPAPVARWALAAAGAAGGWLAGQMLEADYGGWGVWTVLLFYLFPGAGMARRLGQLGGMLLIHGVLMGSAPVYIPLGPLALPVPIQIFAVAALPLIWLYRGRQGPHGRALRLLFYGFYPAHMLLLAALRAWLLYIPPAG